MSDFLANGFRSAGMSVGLKSTGKPDLALVVNEGPQPSCAVVFTGNRAQANPIRWSREVIAQENDARVVLLNSGGANCFTGEFGYETVRLSAEAVAANLDGLKPHQVLVCSTGLIGAGGQDFRDRIVSAVPALCERLSTNDSVAPEAILTTDSIRKTATYQGAGWTIAAMAKGAGMLAPGLATMLAVITTDAVVSAERLQHALTCAADRTFNRIDADGCMSTNDQVTLLASGASGVPVDMIEFGLGLEQVCDSLAAQLQADAEGALHDIDIMVRNAASEADAVRVGRALARNNLFKTAIFGNDPNWGRVLAAIGVADARFDPYRVDVSFNGVRLCSAGAPDRSREECDLTPRRTEVLIDLNAGDESALIRTSDLTVGYVHENSAYAS